jgi:hypothetical protein
VEHLNWELFDYHSYSPDLTPSDYRLFIYQRNWLGSQRFNNNENFFDSGIHVQNVISRYKNLNSFVVSSSLLLFLTAHSVLLYVVPLYLFLNAVGIAGKDDDSVTSSSKSLHCLIAYHPENDAENS